MRKLENYQKFVFEKETMLCSYALDVKVAISMDVSGFFFSTFNKLEAGRKTVSDDHFYGKRPNAKDTKPNE